jgi:predicted nuclease of predicted toxin-antitoxin system
MSLGRWLIDVNVPRVPVVWFAPTTTFVVDLQSFSNSDWTDTELWSFATTHDMTIVSKDADFTHRLLASKSGPHVVNIRLGNMRLSEFRQFIEGRGQRIASLSEDFRLVEVYRNRIEQRG